MILDFLKKLFGIKPTPSQPASVAIGATVSRSAAATVATPPKAFQAAPGQAGQVPSLNEETMLHREIVLNRDLQICGYNFRMRESVLKRRSKMAHSVWKLYDEVLLRNFLAEEASKAFGQKQIFLDISVWSIDSPLLSKLPKGRFVLMLRYDPDFFRAAIQHLDLLHELKAQGFKLGFDGFPITEELTALFPLADYHKVSVTEKDLTSLSQAIDAVAKAAPHAEMMVGDIHYFEELQVCRQLHVGYLQGSYLRHKEMAEADDVVDVGYLRLLEVLNLVRSEAEPPVIAAAMKYDPLLTFKLLRYVNSAGAGLVTKVDTIERALIVLGNKQLYRWLTLLMFSHERQDNSQSVLLETALIRARMMEVLAGNRFSREQLDQLFTTGMFSMLDALLRQPMSRILEKLNLPDDINEALLYRRGPYAALLVLALGCEDGELPDDPHIFEAAGVSKSEANRAQLEAMMWVEEVV